MQDSWAYKSPENFSKSVKGFTSVRRLFIKKWKFLIFWATFPPHAPIEVKFCTAKRTQVPVGPAKFDLNWCNESPLWSEKLIFGL